MYKKGFTLIELLVVIIIIGILAGIVSAMLNAARTRAAVVAAKSNMNGIPAQAEHFATSNDNSYDQSPPADRDVCNPSASAGGVPGIHAMILAAVRNNDPSGTVAVDAALSDPPALGVCHSPTGGSGWAAEVKLKDDTYYCISSAGPAKISDAAMLNSATDITC